jgi:hypothetical protein
VRKGADKMRLFFSSRFAPTSPSSTASLRPGPSFAGGAPDGGLEAQENANARPLGPECIADQLPVGRSWGGPRGSHGGD